MSIQFKILLSRFLTRFGDQAWDFAIPLVLISIFPGQLQNVAGYYLATKIAQFFINPLVCRWIDQFPRRLVYKIGIGAQTFSVVSTWMTIIFCIQFLENPGNFSFWLSYSSLGIFGIIGSLGATLMEVSVGFDLAADKIPHSDLALFNSRLKRIDLLTEVVAPIFAGLLLMIPQVKSHHIGFSLIAVLNFITFIPEYILLGAITSEGEKQKAKIGAESYMNPIQEFKEGIRHFNDQIFAVPMVAYAFLWLSALSPHGVLLSSYLKDSAFLTEFQISVFRGLGAFFGLIPTFLYPNLISRFGLIKTAKLFLGYQTVCVVFSGIFLTLNSSQSKYLFLGMILLSRTGLYGFSLAESEARQVFIPSSVRGRVNGVGVSLASFATLILFGIGTLLPKSSDFSIIVWISILSVFIGFLVLLRWGKK
jgi:iron-regulated transporter 1